MSSKLQQLAARRALLVSQANLQRMELALHVADLRDTIKPSRLLGRAIVGPPAAIALAEAIVPIFGGQRLARFVRIASIGFAVFRVITALRRG